MVVAMLNVVLLLAGFTSVTSLWQEDVPPRHYAPLDEEEVVKFSSGKQTKDFFRVLYSDASSLMIGARDALYNLSATDLVEERAGRLEWRASEEDVTMCLMKGLDEETCHNYIRVFAKTGDNQLLVCGTNAFKPQCRTYAKSPDGGFVKVGDDANGIGLAPYDPRHNSTTIYADGAVYAGTVADIAGSDPLVYRHRLRTEQFEMKQLNAPNFVGSVEYGDYIYFFLRETAVEYMNCGKTVYSRVARVCKNDRGGPYKYRNNWTSFLKARLNCSIPGEYPFYFNEIQSISDIRTVTYGNRTEDILYAVFTTPPNSIPGSAVCAFSMKDVMRAFNGPFKHQDNMNSNWLPYRESQVPEPRPGQCVNDSRSLPDLHINFIRSHPLMDRPVSSLHGGPLLVRTSLRQRFTQIAVDWQVPAADQAAHDVLFIATDTGRVLKAVNAAAGPVLVEELQVFPPGARITSLLVAAGRLVAATEDEVRSVPLHRCTAAAAGRCSLCVRLQDPYCGWAPRLHRCVAVSSAGGQPLLQNITHGLHPSCPDDGGDYNILYNEATKAQYSRSRSQGIYTAEAMAAAVITTCLLAAAVGFLAGWLFSRRFWRTPGEPFYATPHLDHQSKMRQMESATQLKPDNRYDCDVAKPDPPPPPPPNNAKQINIVVNHTKDNSIDKNLYASAGNKTLQKVRKMYL